MISSRPAGAASAVRLLLLTVLLGLFGMHVLTAHGSDHHGVATIGVAGEGYAGHHGATPDTTATGGTPQDDPHSAASAQGRTPPAGSLADTVPAGVSAVVLPGAPIDGVGLMACWLLITVGTALLALLFRSRRVPAAETRTPTAIGGARPGRPRAPPGRVRLHELTVLRV